MISWMLLKWASTFIGIESAGQSVLPMVRFLSVSWEQSPIFNVAFDHSPAIHQCITGESHPPIEYGIRCPNLLLISSRFIRPHVSH